MSPQHEFELFLRHTVPGKLHISASKKEALNIKFYHFSDIIKPLTEKAPTEFKLFFDAFKSKFDEIEKWKSPRGRTLR